MTTMQAIWTRFWRQQTLLICCWLLVDTSLFVSSQVEPNDGYLISDNVLEYINIAAQLYESASDPDLPNQIGTIAPTLGFQRLSYYWEAPFNAAESDFAQVLLGRRDAVCYAVFHGLALDPAFRFVPNPQPLPFLLQQEDCDPLTEDCSCRAHWLWVDMNFPQYWQEVINQLEVCMTSCSERFGDQCEMVLAGHGTGGSVATILSMHFATTSVEPYVITAGSPDVMYDNNCPGINEDRYFRFVNTDIPGNGDDSASEVLYFLGVCFDDVPFVGATEMYGIGYTIGMGLEKGGMAIATGGTGQLVTFKDEATRRSRCRSAHNLLSYKQKMQSAFVRNPWGVTPVGFTNFQYCELDQDCGSSSSCQPSDDYPICTALDGSVPEPTPQPTNPPSSKSPTPGPTAKPTPNPTSPGPTASPTSEPTTARPTEPPTRLPETSLPTRDPTPPPTRYPTATPTTLRPTEPDATRSPTTVPTKAPSQRPTAAPTGSPTTKQTEANIVATSAPAIGPTSAPSPSEADEENGITLTEPTITTSPEKPSVNTNTTTEEDITGTPTTPAELVFATGQPTQTPMPSLDDILIDVAETSAPTLVVTKPPAEYEVYESNDEGTAAPTQKPGITPSPTLSTAALPLFDAFYRTTLVLRDVTDELTGFTVFLWEDETSDHLRYWIDSHTKENNWDPPIVQLRVQANIVSQSVLFTTETVEQSTERAEETTTAVNVKEAKEDEDDPNAETSKKDKSRKSRRLPKGRRIRQRRRRKLQATTAESLHITFEVAIAYRTLNVQELDLYGLILEAFQSVEGRKQYSKRLMGSKDQAFDNMSDFILQIQEIPNGVETPSDSGEQNKTIFWVLIGAAAAAVVLSLGLFLWYLKRVNSRGQKLEDPTASGNNGIEKAIFEPASASNNRLSPDGTPVPRVSQEIVVDDSHDDGISTLGDPTFYPGAPPMQLQDEQTASVNYAQNYLKMHDQYDDNNRTFRSDQQSSTRSAMKDTLSSGSALSKVGSGLSNLNGSAIFSDDDSFEEQFAGENECFEVQAPQGKLGIIIDLSGNGEPMVRAIRGDSVLADKVKIGDRLLSVDGEGCAELSAEHVSKLIAVKSNQACRKIMFVRRPADYM